MQLGDKEMQLQRWLVYAITYNKSTHAPQTLWCNGWARGCFFAPRGAPWICSYMLLGVAHEVCHSIQEDASTL